MKNISLAYSPDSDDAFMVYAMQEECIDLGKFQFDFIRLDIQELNALAMQNQFDITAVSFAVFPKIWQDYWLMRVGASVGDGFGPALVVRDDSPIQVLADLKKATIAIPGENTSANFALHACLDVPFQKTFLPFHAIAETVQNKIADAGVLIHELQLNFHEHGLRKIGDLGELWQKRYQLPLPLGANVIRKSLGADTARKLSEIYTNSIQWALKNRTEMVRKASARAVSGLAQADLADRYISMYVNNRSLNLANDVHQALQVLFKKGAEFGFCETLPGSEEFFLN